MKIHTYVDWLECNKSDNSEDDSNAWQHYTSVGSCRENYVCQWIIFAVLSSRTNILHQLYTINLMAKQHYCNALTIRTAKFVRWVHWHSTTLVVSFLTVTQPSVTQRLELKSQETHFSEPSLIWVYAMNHIILCVYKQLTADLLWYFQIVLLGLR